MEGIQIEWEWVCAMVLRNSLQGTPQQQQGRYTTGHQCLYVDCLMGLPDGSDGKESACNAREWVPSLGQEDLEKGMATHSIHSSILAWRIP